MATAGRLHIGKQLFVGSTFPIPLLNPVGFGVGPGLTQGSAYFEGPTYMGHAQGCFGDATLAVGRCQNVSAAAAARALSLFKVSTKGVPPIPPTPIDVMLGDPAVGVVGIMANSFMINILNQTFINVMTLGPMFITAPKILTTAGIEIVTATQIKEGIMASLGSFAKVGGSVYNEIAAIFGIDFSFAKKINAMTVSPCVVGKCTGDKGFDIPHPNQKGKRVRHICVEGPESAIYIRGQLKDESIIKLPDYWNGLVDPETITVTLTPFGRPQSLYIESIPYGRKIIIKSEDGTQPNCHYNVWANRIGAPLHVEYEGESPADYPGDQSTHSIAGYHYDTRSNLTSDDYPGDNSINVDNFDENS